MSTERESTMNITYTISNFFEQNTNGEFVHTGHVEWASFRTWEAIIADNARWAELCHNEILRNEVSTYRPDFSDKDEECVVLEFRVGGKGPVQRIEFTHLVADEYLPA